MERPYKVPGYPITPIIYILLALTICLILLFADYRTFHENDVLMVRLESGSRVKAVVKKVLPNGDLVLEGKGILGVARSLDIAQDNSVRSAYLSRAPLEVAGR